MRCIVAPDGTDPQIYFDPEDPQAEAGDLLGEGGPWVVEVGTGNGTFMAREAAAHPDVAYIGIERATEFFGKFKRRMIREGLTNVRCICANVEDVFELLLPPDSASQIIINFSDPWPKRRHRDRRVFKEALFPLMERVLARGGTVRFKTDVGWYFNFAIELVRARPGWEVVEARPFTEREEAQDGSPDAPPVRPMTSYEQKGREAGRNIWGFVARWTDDAEATAGDAIAEAQAVDPVAAKGTA